MPDQEPINITIPDTSMKKLEAILELSKAVGLIAKALADENTRLEFTGNVFQSAVNITRD
jgi:hypothetical protein